MSDRFFPCTFETVSTRTVYNIWQRNNLFAARQDAMAKHRAVPLICVQTFEKAVVSFREMPQTKHYKSAHRLPFALGNLEAQVRQMQRGQLV